MKRLLVLAALAAVGLARGEWVEQLSGSRIEFRVVSAVSEKVCWAAGSGGAFARTIDGQKWDVGQVPGAQLALFRGLVAFDADHATLLAIGAGDQSKIYQTADGGKTWVLRWVNRNPKAFFDAIAFWDHKHGIGFSDSVDGQFPIVRTDDGGVSWHLLAHVSAPPALKGEAGFAASGTSIVVQGGSTAWYGTGGANISRVFKTTDRGQSWTAFKTPMPAGTASSGIFGLRFTDALHGIAVGGDFRFVVGSSVSVALTSDGGKTWKATAIAGQGGLGEGAAYFPGGLIVVGPSGSEVSRDGGKTWTIAHGSVTGLHACDFVGQTGWAAGNNGTILRWYSPRSRNH